jgi:predicted  nucleic acid-binding Zn-ribbon protein
MPYKCTVCGKTYLEGSDEIKEVMRKGSCECGKKFLMYFRGTEAPPVGERPRAPWAPEGSKPHVVRDLPSDVGEDRMKSFEWLDREFIRMREQGKELHLGIETIQILEEGKYMIDIGSLMQGKPIVVRTEEGVYYIDLAYAMKKKKS